MQGINLSVDSLQAAMRRVRAEVMGPYTAITSQTAQLINLQAAGDLLRHVLHHLKLVARLKVNTATIAVFGRQFVTGRGSPPLAQICDALQCSEKLLMCSILIAKLHV